MFYQCYGVLSPGKNGVYHGKDEVPECMEGPKTMSMSKSKGRRSVELKTADFTRGLHVSLWIVE